MKVNIHQAKTHLSRLLQRVAGGEEITIARAAVPIACLVSVEPERVRRPLDLDRGVYEVPGDFDAPLPAEILAAFNGKPSKGAGRLGRAGGVDGHEISLGHLGLAMESNRLGANQQERTCSAGERKGRAILVGGQLLGDRILVPKVLISRSI